MNNREATFGPAEQPYDFIYIDDLLNAVYLLGIKKTLSNYYFIGSGNPKVLKEYLYIIGKKMGKEKLIKIGVRPDDGIKYDYNMFDIRTLKSDIGEYISKNFEEGIEETIKRF